MSTKTDIKRAAALEIHNLTVAYNQRPVLWDIDLKVPQGKIIGIVGPNGAGKSTLLKAVMEIIPSSSGYVRIFDKPLAEVRKYISYVPQRESVDWDFPASVLDVVLMGRFKRGKLFNRTTTKDKEIAWSALEKVNMTSFANRQISQLSGGQQQRVFLARSLAQEAQLYLMDEPFAGVDAASEAAILHLLQEIKNEGKTLIIVHHDLHTAQEFFDWVILLNTHLVACGPMNEVFTKEHLSEAYGGELTLLAQLAEIIKEKEFPLREKNFQDR